MQVLKKLIVTLVATAPLMALWNVASAAPYVLVAWHQRSTSGALSSLMFKAGAAQGCPGPTYTQPCYNPAQPWVSSTGVATDVIASGAPTWDWNGTTMTMTGLFWATSTIGSNPNATPVISDRITNLTITPGTLTTTATTYACYEGTFLAGVGSHGCANVTLGGDFNYDGSVAYNVGGSANCINRTIGGDDVSSGNPRGVFSTAAGGGCDAIDGGFNHWVIVPNTRFLILSNQASIIGSDGCYMFGRASTAAASPCVSDALVAGASYLVFAPSVDADSDGLVDALDNCSTRANPVVVAAGGNAGLQVDSDGDGFGNRCDGDFNQNNVTNSQDYILFRQQLGQPSVAPTFNSRDHNANGAVNSQDYILFRGLLGAAPGPSGLCTFPCPIHP